MIQYLRLKDKDTIVHPPEMASSKKIAEKMWDEENVIECDINREDNPNCLDDRLVDGKVVFSESRLSDAKLANDLIEETRLSKEKELKRAKAKHEQIKNLDPSVATKDWDNLTEYERKLIFNIGGGPTDEELGIEE